MRHCRRMWKLAGKPGGGGWAASLLPGGLRRGRDPALCPLGQRPHRRRDQEPGGKGWRYHSFICSCIHTSKLPLRLSHARTCQRLETQNRHVHVIPSTEDVLCHLIPQVRSPSGHCREIPGGQTGCWWLPLSKCTSFQGSPGHPWTWGHMVLREGPLTATCGPCPALGSFLRPGEPMASGW